MKPCKLIVVCRACPDRTTHCRGACPCPIDDKPAADHAREAYCPAGRYRLGLGDTIARVLHVTGVARLVRRLKLPCGCKKRQQALNNR